MTYRVIFIVLIGVVELVVAQYNIVQIENIDDYKIVSITTTHTYTECILNCDHDNNCLFVSIQDNGIGSLSCVFLAERVRMLNLSNPDETSNEKKVLTVTKIGGEITLLSQLNKTTRKPIKVIPTFCQHHPVNTDSLQNRIENSTQCTTWSNLSLCNVTCGQGFRFRERTCLQKCPDDDTKEYYVKEKETVDECFFKHLVTLGEWKRKTIYCSCSGSASISNGFVNVISAKYGSKNTTDCMKDVSGIIKPLCQNKHSCKLNANNQVFGDPCPTFYKSLYMKYECRRSQV